MTKQIVTQEELKKQFHYDPLTGIFTRLATGFPAGFINKSLGYVVISVNNKRYYAHRLAFLYMTGEMPKFADHRHGIRHDNRWSELRPATKSQNNMNSGLQRNNTSGYTGVVFHRNRNKPWAARGKINGVTKCLGYYYTPELAYEAYKEFSRKHYGEYFKEI